jgi:hypothetical protein
MKKIPLLIDYSYKPQIFLIYESHGKKIFKNSPQKNLRHINLVHVELHDNFLSRKVNVIRERRRGE